MHIKPAPASVKKEQGTDPASPAGSQASARFQTTAEPKPLAASELAGDEQMAAALMELDLQGAQRRSRRVGPLKKVNIPVQLQEHATAERANRATLDEIAAALGVSRSAANWILDEPTMRTGGKHAEHKGGVKRHDHGTGRRRHAG
jgi:hypothetical protein